MNAQTNFTKGQIVPAASVRPIGGHVRRWHVLRVRPQLERVAAHHLARRGVATAIPFREEYRRPNRFARSKVKFLFPVMPGYVLAELPTPTNWFEVFKLRSIAGVLLVDGGPAHIPEDRVMALLRRWGGHGIIPVAPEARHMLSGFEFSEGDTVEITGGTPFDGMQSRVQKISDATARVMLPLFGGEREIDVPLHCMIAID